MSFSISGTGHKTFDTTEKAEEFERKVADIFGRASDEVRALSPEDFTLTGSFAQLGTVVFGAETEEEAEAAEAQAEEPEAEESTEEPPTEL